MSDISAISALFSPSGKIRKENIFYSSGDGYWNDPKIWLSNCYGRLPGSNDVVVINHTINVNNGFRPSIKDLIVNGTLRPLTNSTLTIYGNLQSNGTIDCTGSNGILQLYGWDNYVNNFIGGNSLVRYMNNLWQQEIMNIPYYSLSIWNRGRKVLNFDLNLPGSFDLYNSDFDLGTYNLYVTGGSSFSGNMVFRKTGPGTITLVGNVFEPGYGDTFDFSGNPTVNLGGDWRMLTTWATGTGNGIVYFTNSSYINSAGNSCLFNLTNAIIKSGVTTHLMAESYINSINGEDATSILQCDRGDTQPAGEFRKTIHFTGITQPMAIGQLDCTTYGSTISYSRNGDQEIKGATYDYLILTGSGVKKLMGDVTVPTAKYTLSGTATLDTNGFNFTLT